MPGKNSTRPRPLGLDILEKSTQINHSVVLALTLLLMYVFGSTMSITDLQLTENHKTMNLLLLNATIPFSLIQFGYVAPPLILVVHLIVMMSLCEHALKLNAWVDEQGRTVGPAAWRRELPFSPFNLAHIKNTGTAILAGTVIYLAVFFLPLITLLYLEIRFADIHDTWLTFAHVSVIVGDVVLISRYYKTVTGGSPSDKRFAIARRLLVSTLSVLTFAALVNFMVVFIITGESYKLVADYYPLPVPRLTVSNRTIDMNEPGEKDSVYCITPDTKRRDFTFAQFTACHFVEAKLPGVRMMMADLEGTNLNGAILQQGNFAGSNMKNVSLHGAYLFRANLTDACLQDANLTRANLERAILARTDFRRAILDHAKMNDETYLTGNLLRGASMDGVNLQNAHLEDLNLEGVNLRNADLQGAMILRCNFQGADLQNANLSGASIGITRLQGADLTGCTLQGTLFSNCYLYAVNWPHDIAAASATLVDVKNTMYMEKFPSEKELEKTHQELKEINFQSNFLERMHDAQLCVAPSFGYGPGKRMRDEFTAERIRLLDDCGVRIDHLWLQAGACSPLLDLAFIKSHNRKITEHCLKYYPHRVKNLSSVDIDKFPGANPFSEPLTFANNSVTVAP